MNRKNATKGILASAGVPVARDAIYNNSDAPQPFTKRAGYRHSVCRWTHSSVPLEELWGCH